MTSFAGGLTAPACFFYSIVKARNYTIGLSRNPIYVTGVNLLKTILAYSLKKTEQAEVTTRVALLKSIH